MKILLNPSDCLAQATTSIGDLPSWTLAFPAIIGAIAITLYQLKKGDSAINAVGKVLLGFGCGFFLGSHIAAKLLLDRLAGAFIGSLASPFLVSVVERKVKEVFNKP